HSLCMFRLFLMTHALPAIPPPSIPLYSSFSLHAALPSFPTRRSSDLTYLVAAHRVSDVTDLIARLGALTGSQHAAAPLRSVTSLDRKSTRLNSSHEWISYAVFCLKKKNSGPTPITTATGKQRPSARFS